MKTKGNYILKGKRVIEETDLLKWAGWLETANRRIAATTLKNGKRVSTVFLGLNHNFGAGRPLLFETMVFKSKETLGELDIDRYSTYKQAEEGHKKMVKKWRKIEEN